ncbi:MAG TPA: DGQHR domain-containing protein [candidate division Zixibacteria bacterium]|nr:DGQHR domain-containing protein [candidate division Zixibacteria bacterium]
MLATRVVQKEGAFYFVAYKAPDLLERVRFTSRYYFEGEEIEAEEPGEDEVAKFIAGIERSEKSFQRVLNRRKIRQIVNFYENAVSQPLIPGTILLFTEETLRFRRSDLSEQVGFLSEPGGKFLVIDGQHRLAALHFYRQRHPELADQLDVPCVLFDGKSGDFATEMFVIINSTHTRINKSHLVDLYERVSWETPEKKLAARVVNLLYEQNDSPLRYRINRLGGRSRQEKWILQSELFNELYKVVQANRRFFDEQFQMRADRLYPLVRDYLKAVREVMEAIWGDNEKFMFTRDVTLKALLRVFGDLLHNRKLIQAWQEERSPGVFAPVLRPWSGLAREFRSEGFYERFPAKGQIERVRRIHLKLAQHLNPG